MKRGANLIPDILRASLWAMACGVFLSSQVIAQVISIGDDGTATTLCTPAQNAMHHQASQTQQPIRNARAIPPAYQSAFEAAAARYELSPDLLQALAWQESRFNAEARSSKGALGLMQLMPATARSLGVDPHDPTQNIMGGAAYLRYMLNAYDGKIDLALAAYNAGQGAVNRYGGIPPYKETRTYVSRNLDHLAALSEIGDNGRVSAPPYSDPHSVRDNELNSGLYIEPCR